MSLSRQIPSALLLSVLVLTAGVYSRLNDAEFILLDDDAYIYENPHIQDGLSWAGIRWAFSAELLEASEYADYWRPLTFVSHMVDVELFGLNPAGHHLTNVAFHLINILLVYVLLRQTTGHPYPSLFVAAVFALHPLQVESVAWVTERKDVLSTCLGLLSLWTYCAYAKQPGRTRYAVAVGVFALGLTAKPMLVTLPCVMLLLDLWPLGRMEVVFRPESESKGMRRIRLTGTPGFCW